MAILIGKIIIIQWICFFVRQTHRFFDRIQWGAWGGILIRLYVGSVIFTKSLKMKKCELAAVWRIYGITPTNNRSLGTKTTIWPWVYFASSCLQHATGGPLRFYAGFPTYYVRIAPHAMLTLIAQDFIKKSSSPIWSSSNLVQRFCRPSRFIGPSLIIRILQAVETWIHGNSKW